jgi:preprotein translocase subunit YajC
VSVSVGVFVLVAAMVGMCFILRKRRKKQSSLANLTQFDKAELDSTNEQSSAQPAIKYRVEVQEHEGQHQIQEMGDNERVHGAGGLAELSADQRKTLSESMNVHN